MKTIFKNIAGIVMPGSKLLKIGLLTSLVFTLILMISASAEGKKEGKKKDELRVFTALLTGGQEVPVTESKAFGVAFLTFNEKTNMLCYSISFSDTTLSGTETAAHFHGPAVPGVSADVMFAITPVPGNPKNGCAGPLSEKQREQLRKGLIYINIHSSASPGGEIRGQVLSADERKFKVEEEEGEGGLN